MDLELQRDLKVLEAIAQEERVTQRGLAANLGIALGLANLYIKRLVRKGYIKCVNVQSNRILYLITPKGIAEKTRLTFEYIEYSLHLYRQVRLQLRAVLHPLQSPGHKRIAIYGTGEIAELAYLSVKEAGLDLTAVFDDDGTRTFLGMPVHDIREQGGIPFDLLVIAVLDPVDSAMTHLVAQGVPPDKICSLQRVAGTPAVPPS